MTFHCTIKLWQTYHLTKSSIYKHATSHHPKPPHVVRSDMSQTENSMYQSVCFPPRNSFCQLLLLNKYPKHKRMKDVAGREATKGLKVISKI